MRDQRRVLITGAGGQVAKALLANAPAGVAAIGMSRAELDICDAASVARAFAEHAPDAIINTAAYTAVDRAESEPEAAFRINREGPGTLARAALMSSVRLVHISTDFVFDGCAGSAYTPDAEPAPLSVYGASKAAGEREVLQALPRSSCVLRTAWVYSASGSNFVRTMLRLMAERGAVSVVDEQIGSPTAADSVATVLWALAGRQDLSGIFHWTDAGVASWYDFAVAIAEEAVACGMLPKPPAVRPIAAADYPTAARRPRFSVLDSRRTASSLSIDQTHWRSRLRTVIQELAIA